MDEPAARGGGSTRPPSAGSIRLCGSVERARYLEIEIAISRQLSYLRLIQDRAFLNTMVIIITIIYYYSLRLNTRRGLRAHGRIRLVWVPPSSARRGPNLGGGARARERRARRYVYYIYSRRHRS